MTPENLNMERHLKIMNFFDNDISAERFAKIIRRYNHELSLMIIRHDEEESVNVINKQWIDDGYYWLSELAEILDPNLSKD